MDSLNIIQELDDLGVTRSVACGIDSVTHFVGNSNQNTLSILTQNIRSIYKNIDDLQITLSQLPYDMDILILTECRLKPSKPVPKLPNYSHYCTTILLNQNDGVVVYVKDNLQTKIKQLNLSDATGLQITVSNHVILGIYRSPSHTNADNFVTSLHNYLDSISKYKNIMLLGDININLIVTPTERAQDRNNRLNYLNVLSSCGFLPGHNFPTRINSCLDHAMLKLDNNSCSSLVAVLNTSVTDHQLVILNINLKKKLEISSRYKTVTNYENAYKTLLEMDVTALNIYTDPETYAATLIETVRSAITSNSRTTPIPSKSRIIKPWITLGVLRCIRLRNAMQIKLKLNTHNDILKITYKRFRNYCNNLIKKLKRAYNKSLITQTSKKPKKLWSTINNITQYKQPKTTNSELLNISTSPQLSVTFVNSHFIGIGQNLAEAIIKRVGQLPNSYTATRTQYINHSSFVLLDTDPPEVNRIIMSLDSESAPGWDGINTKFIKLAKDFLIPLITNLANLCFQAGTFPKVFKRSIVTPVHKGGDKGDLHNYRPISVLSSTSKILEKLLNNRLVSYLDKFNVLCDTQYGFRKKMSTQDAILSITSEIVREVDKGGKCLVVFLDLKKAFDTVSIPILVHRLEGIGVRGTALSLFKSYLHDRTQKVKIDNYQSTEEEVLFGVPQGSVLGPTLFLIYINEMCNLRSVGGRIVSYADDTAIVFTGGSWDDVRAKAERGLLVVSEWLDDNLLTLNIAKTNFMCFSPTIITQPGSDFEVRIHRCGDATSLTCSCPALQRVACTKYLGIMVDQRLSWHSHIEVTMNRIRKLNWIFRTLRSLMTAQLLNQIYVAMAQSVINYCIVVWGGANKTNFLNIERAQRSLVKVMYCKPYRFSTDSLYKISGLLSVRKLYVLHLILRCHRSLPLTAELSRKNKRRKDTVATLPSVRTMFARRQYEYQSAFIYNKINRLLKIHPMHSLTCKNVIINWLNTLTYDEVENLFVRLT